VRSARLGRKVRWKIAAVMPVHSIVRHVKSSAWECY
jgi:hypothetical protein